MQIDVEPNGELKLLNREVGLYFDPDKSALKKISSNNKTAVILRSQLADLEPADEHHGKVHTFSRPGEYEVGGVFVRGLSLHATESDFEHTQLLYIVTMDHVAMLRLPEQLIEPDEDLIEAISPLEVVTFKILQDTLPETVALVMKWVKALNPRLFIIHSSDLSLLAVKSAFKPLANNLTEPLSDYKFLKRDLPEKMQVMWLQQGTNS